MVKTSVSVLVLVSVCISGCGSSTTVVRGKVTYKDKPVTSGEVNFLSATGLPSRSGLIGADGSYEIRDAPLGEVKITVVSYKSAESAKPTVGEKGKKLGGAPALES